MGNWLNYYFFFWQVYGAHNVCVPICSGFISFTVIQFPGKKRTQSRRVYFSLGFCVTARSCGVSYAHLFVFGSIATLV